MNKIKVVKLILFTCTWINMYSQEEEPDWFTFSTSITGDFTKNLQGGINTNYTYIGMEELSFEVDIEKLGLWKGASIFLHGLNSHGIAPSEEIVGDLQVASNIESGNYTGFYEYYIKQKLGDFSFILGQHDLNSEFIFTEYGGTFINSSFGIAPTMSLNIPVSIYPIAAPALIASYENKKHKIELGIYDGDPGNPEENRYNLQPNISNEEGLLFIGEYQYNFLVNDLPESYKIGGYYHTNTFTDYSDTLNSVKGNYGFYTVLDLVLWSGFNHPDRYLGMFIQSSWAPKNINQLDYYLGAGIHFNGLLPTRFNDVIGLAFAYANISSQYIDLYNNILGYETAVELTYKLNLFDRYCIQPNLQYIIQPGANPDLENALLAILRFIISLEN